ncbi:MAG: LacI family transcriptional regulator [Propionibacteriaceae bacterium]|nr:LacI family transcriptional regulator [Propionibacteriaceae bacterium]
MPTNRGPARPTQRQIAALVGVSVTTVSRILNPEESNPFRWASEETVEAIRQAAVTLGYRHNALAVSLRTSRSHTVGVLMPLLGDHVMAMIFAGIDEVAREHGMMAITASTLDEPTIRVERSLAMQDRLVDGLIFADAHIDKDYLSTLKDQGVAFTLVHRRHPNHVSVSADDLLAGRLAARHLIEIGRTRLAIICRHRYMSTSTDRIQGFCDEIREAGLEPPAVLETGFNVVAGRDAAYMMMEHPPYPDGVWAINDASALGALSVFRQRGLNVPDDVAIIGFYDSPVAWGIDLTSIRVSLHQMGRRSIELLLDRLDGKPVESEILPVSLIVRRSTDSTRPIGSDLGEVVS